MLSSKKGKQRIDYQTMRQLFEKLSDLITFVRTNVVGTRMPFKISAGNQTNYVLAHNADQALAIWARASGSVHVEKVSLDKFLEG